MDSSNTDFDDEIVAEVAGSIETCLQRHEPIDAVLEDLHERKLRDEPVQDDLNRVFEQEPYLCNIALVDANEKLEPMLEAIEAGGHLNEDGLEAFEAFWARHDWIASGVEAFRLELEHGGQSWTDAGFELAERDGDLYVTHRMRWGVDKVHEIEAPLSKVCADWVSRLKALLVRLKQTDTDLSETDPELLASIAESLADIQTTLDGIEDDKEPSEIVADMAAGDRDDEPEDTDSSLVGFA